MRGDVPFLPQIRRRKARNGLKSRDRALVWQRLRRRPGRGAPDDKPDAATSTRRRYWSGGCRRDQTEPTALLGRRHAAPPRPLPRTKAAGITTGTSGSACEDRVRRESPEVDPEGSGFKVYARLISLLAVVAALLAASSARPKSGEEAGPREVEEALTRHLESLAPTVSGVVDSGRIRAVECAFAGATFRGRDMYTCEVTHQRGTIALWCAAIVDRRVYTQLDSKRLECAKG